MQIRFKRDTAFRKQLFVPDSFSHPAKMDAQLLQWIVERYTEVGETILDPMFGSGTLMLACTLGRNVIGVELEQKFVDMAKANWNEVKMRPQLGSTMGQCQIIQGDARNLEGILADKIITSPPYEGSVDVPNSKQDARAERLKKAGYDPKKYQGGRGRNLQQDWSYHPIDSIITSPPYSNPRNTSEEYDDKYDLRRPKGVAWGRESFRGRYSSDQQDDKQIGNLKSLSYLSAMESVYQQCHKVLKPQGLMILVVKNFLREQKEVDLRGDTIKLCEQSGFQYIEEHHRILPAQSFWRVIYQKRYPLAPVIDREYVLVFEVKG